MRNLREKRPLGVGTTTVSENRTYSFGEYTLDLARGALLRSGADVKLRPKSFEVLRLLVERHGRLVTKEELLDAVWGRTVVTEGSIVQCLIDVRRAIGDESQQMVKTVPRRGYIFDLPVTRSDGAPQETPVAVTRAHPRKAAQTSARLLTPLRRNPGCARCGRVSSRRPSFRWCRSPSGGVSRAEVRTQRRRWKASLRRHRTTPSPCSRSST